MHVQCVHTHAHTHSCKYIVTVCLDVSSASDSRTLAHKHMPYHTLPGVYGGSQLTSLNWAFLLFSKALQYMKTKLRWTCPLWPHNFLNSRSSIFKSNSAVYSRKCFLHSHDNTKHHIISSSSRHFILLINVSKLLDPKPEKVLHQKMWIFYSQKEERSCKKKKVSIKRISWYVSLVKPPPKLEWVKHSADGSRRSNLWRIFQQNKGPLNSLLSPVRTEEERTV